MPEQFQVIFNSRNSISAIATATDRCNLTYNMNWGSILPKKYKRFLCQFTFLSEQNLNTVITETGLVNINLPSNNFNANSRLNTIGVIHPNVQFYTSNINNQSFFQCSTNDNNNFYMSYPTENQITISINKLDGSVLSICPHYILALSFQGVSEVDEKNDNYADVLH